MYSLCSMSCFGVLKMLHVVVPLIFFYVGVNPDLCPEDIRDFLSQSKKCDICSGCYINYHHELIIASRYSAWQESELPVFMNLCSAECLSSVKEGKRPKLVHSSCG